MKKLVLPVIVVLSLLSLALTGCGGTEAATVEEKITPVEASPVVNGEIERILIYAGQVKPSEQIAVLPKIGGTVEQVFFDVGDRVNKDDVLFAIDPTDVESSIDAAQAQYNASLSGVSSARAGLEIVAGSQTENQLMQLESAVTNAEMLVENSKLALDNAKRTLESVETSYNNAKILYEAGTLSKTSFDDIELGYKQAQAGLEKSQNDATQAETGLVNAKEAYELYVNRTKESSVKQAQSGVNQAAAASETARVSLSNAERSLQDLQVKSPITGVITTRNVTAGAMVGQGSLAFVVIDMDTVEVDVSVSEELINLITPGMTVSVNVSSISSEPFSGVISTISPSADEMKNTYPVRITIENKNGELKPGMFAEVSFTKERSENTIVLPRNTVLNEEDKSFVFVVENNTAKKVFVETGIDNGKEIEIISGLTEGDSVVTKGQTYVADGEKIKIVSE